MSGFGEAVSAQSTSSSLVGVRRHVDRDDLGTHRPVVAEELELSCTLAERIASGARGLEADEQHRVAIVSDAMREVVQDASARRHARRRDDDHRPSALVQLLGLLDGVRLLQLQGREEFGAMELGPDLGGTAPCFGAVDVEGPTCHRTVDEHRQVRDLSGGHELIQIPQHDLGAVDCEGRNHDRPTASRRLVDRRCHHLARIGVIMTAVAVRRFGDQRRRRDRPDPVGAGADASIGPGRR